MTDPKDDNGKKKKKDASDADAGDGKQQQQQKKKKVAGGGTAGSASEENAAPYPDMKLCQQIHRLVHHCVIEGEAFDQEQGAVLKQIAEMENPSLYRYLVQQLDEDAAMETSSSTATARLSEDALKAMEVKNTTKMAELEAAVEEARESAGDMEVMEARMAVARFAAQSLDEDQALAAYGKLIDLPKISSGKKIDALMESARVASFYDDRKRTTEFIDRAHKLTTGSGGEWDKRNRLKVYRALLMLQQRNTEDAAKLLVDCIATFTCNEMCPYSDFIGYTILTNLLHLPRPQLKSKIIDGPEVLSVTPDIPVINRLVRAYYDCDYKAYLHAMVDLEDVLKGDRYLAPHVHYWLRELHILAYKQFLDSYQSVTLEAMAAQFGVSPAYIDHHCSRFIAADRITAKIDKFGGVIVTQRPDVKNQQYRDMIQKGDLLLNRIQKLARVVDL